MSSQPPDKRAFKNELFELFAAIGKALASGRRLELLELLAQCERSVEELAELAELSVANTSQHLRVLRAARLVEARKDGLYVRYRLADQQVFRMWQAMRDLGQSRIAEIERLVRTYFADRASLQSMGAEELLRAIKRKGVVVLDVRPQAEYDAGHISGARSIPVTELRRRLREIPNRKRIVAYCRGPYCVYADEAVALLRSQGRTAVRLDIGFPDWKAQGLPVETI